MRAETNIKANDTVMHTLQEKGITNPAIADKTTTIHTLITTGNVDKNNKIPVEAEFVQCEDKEGNAIIPQGTKMVGTVAMGKMLVFDSVVSKEMDEAGRKQLLKALQNMLSQVTFPEKTMAKGDAFTQVTPITLPVGITTIKAVMSVTYKLVDFSDSTANFDLSMAITMDMKDVEVAGSGTGSGNGVMVFDRINEYPLKYAMHYSMDLTADKEPVSVHVTLKSDSEAEYGIKGD